MVLPGRVMRDSMAALHDIIPPMFQLLPIMLAASTLAATNMAPIRTVADALKLSAFDGLGPWPFTLEGQVYSTFHSYVRDFKDATGGYPYEDHRNGGPLPSLGDLVRISGEMVITPEDLHRFKVNHLEIIGHAPPSCAHRPHGRQC